MALLTPLIFAFVYGSMIFTGKLEMLPEVACPWFGIGALAMSLFDMVQLMLNMFGLDRQGFRAYALMPAPRQPAGQEPGASSRSPVRSAAC